MCGKREGGSGWVKGTAVLTAHLRPGALRHPPPAHTRPRTGSPTSCDAWNRSSAGRGSAIGKNGREVKKKKTRASPRAGPAGGGKRVGAGARCRAGALGLGAANTGQRKKNSIFMTHVHSRAFSFAPSRAPPTPPCARCSQNHPRSRSMSYQVRELADVRRQQTSCPRAAARPFAPRLSWGAACPTTRTLPGRAGA